jgi:hypothetical protein
VVTATEVVVVVMEVGGVRAKEVVAVARGVALMQGEEAGEVGVPVHPSLVGHVAPFPIAP